MPTPIMMDPTTPPLATLRLGLAERFTLDLPVPVSAGYQWRMSDASLARVILVEQHFAAPPGWVEPANLSEQRIGGAARQLLTFQAQAEGDQVLILVQARPWLAEQPDDVRMHVPLRVAEASA